jgi:hypothetical protein
MRPDEQGGQGQVIRAAPAAPPPPTPTPSVGSLDGLTYAQLQSRQAELQDQRQALANRRANVAGTYERASGASKEGIAARLAVMDKSMAQFESDLSAVGLAMVPKRPVTGSSVPPFNQRPPNMAGREMLLASVVVFLATMFIAVPAAVRRAKRRWLRESPSAGTNTIGVGNERLDRIEHAVDTIAVEIERVSENQRFMTRLMTETQLAGTIAAVRGSAELAKAAAEESPHA